MIPKIGNPFPNGRGLNPGREDYSWSEIAEKDAAGLCPSSPDYAGPHIVTDGKTCDECGAEVEAGSYGIPPVASDTPGAITCGTCGRSWMEDITPAGRCPWEVEHTTEDWS